MDQTYYSSPLGLLSLEATEEYVTRLDFVEDTKLQHKKTQSKVLQQAIEELDQYFQGKRKTFTVPVKQQGTKFQLAVWNALQEIPYAQTKSYQAIAERVGSLQAVRAVGLTNGKNKVAIIIPCHRVIGKSGKLVGYASGVWRKQWLLEHELKYKD